MFDFIANAGVFCILSALTIAGVLTHIAKKVAESKGKSRKSEWRLFKTYFTVNPVSTGRMIATALGSMLVLYSGATEVTLEAANAAFAIGVTANSLANRSS